MGWEELNPHIRNQNPLYYHYTTAQRLFSYEMKNGWAERIRTPECMDQNHVSYRLTTAQLNINGGEGGIRTLGKVAPTYA